MSTMHTIIVKLTFAFGLTIIPFHGYTQIKEPRFSFDANVLQTDGSIVTVRSETATYTPAFILVKKVTDNVVQLPSGMPLKFIVRVPYESFESINESWLRLLRMTPNKKGDKMTAHLAPAEIKTEDIIECKTQKYGTSSLAFEVDSLAPGYYCIWLTASTSAINYGKYDINFFQVK